MPGVRAIATGFAAMFLAAGFGIASGAPAQAATTAASCVFRVVNNDSVVGDEVKALELSESNGDEIFMRVGGTRFPASTLKTVQFAAPGATSSPAPFDNPVKQFTEKVSVELVEKDFLGIGNDPVGKIDIGCFPQSAIIQFIDGSSGIYHVEYTVSVL